MGKMIGQALGLVSAIFGAAAVAIGLYMLAADPDETDKLIGAAAAIVAAAILAAIIAVQRSLTHR